MKGTLAPIRDFVYLDVDRLKSILAQVDEGYLVETATTTGSAKTVEGGAEAQVPGLAKIGGTGQYVWTNQASETRTLHDHIYNYVERRLAEEKRLLVLDEALTAEAWLSDERRKAIPDTAFILITGAVLINDYRYLKDFLANFNKVAAAVGRFSAQQQIQTSSEAKAKEALALASKQFQLSGQMVADLDLVLKTFVRHETIIKVMPFPDQPDARVVASLDVTGALRTSLETLVFRFGSAPRKRWRLFGQIAAAPLSTDKPYAYGGTLGPEIDAAFQKMFDSLRSFEAMVGSVVYPEISVTPIALYRG